ncbi:MAG: EAL domain-containing protein [Thermoanaerobaculia bacterium]
MAILHAQQEATLDGILVVDLEGRVLSHNQRFLEIWGIPVEVAAHREDGRLLEHAVSRVADRDAFLKTVHELYANPTEERAGEIVPLKDGRVLSRSTLPVIARGQVTGRAWYFRDTTDAVRHEVLQTALFRIAQLSRDASDLEQFYREIQIVVGTLMDATNFYVAEYDATHNILTFPFFVDTFDPPPEHKPPSGGLTSYVLRTGLPLLATPEVRKALIASGEVKQIGALPVDWLGAPLKSGDRTWGVIGIQTYEESGTRYTERERDILLFVAQHVATAIEQKRREDSLRQSEGRYRQMFENNRAVQMVIDPADGSIIDANIAASEFYGWTSEQLRSMSINDINILNADEISEKMANAAKQKQSYFLFRHRLASGDVRDVEVHSGPIESRGRTLLYSIVHDVTERKIAEKALLRSEQKYRDIVNFASVGIYQSTLDGRLLTANPTLARILGFDSVDELLQKNIGRDIYLHQHEREALISKHVPRGSASEVELLWKKKDGTPIWVQLNAHSLDSGGEALMFEGFVYDITDRKLAAQNVASANAQRKAVLDAATRVSIIATDAFGTITMFNAGAERLLGYSTEEMVGHRRVIDLHHEPELLEHAQRLSLESGEKVGGFEILTRRPTREGLEEREWTYVTRGGTSLTVLLSVTALRDESGALTGFLHVGTDVTLRKRVEHMLRTQSAAVTAAMDGIGILNDRFEFSYANDAMAQLFGYSNHQALLGRSLVELYDPPEQVRLVTMVFPLVKERGRWRGEANGMRPDGSMFPQEISLTALEGQGMVAVIRDITERTYAEEQIKHLAYHDALTNLPNRLLFKDRLTVALSHAQRDESRLAVLFMDLDRFKVINDSLGHNIGDQLLQSVAARVQSCVRESDTVARLGGDEFTLLLPGLLRPEDAAVVAQKILEALRYPFHIEGREFFITTSVGISSYPEDGVDAETLIKNADTAMYQAKEIGRDNYQLFNAHVNARALQRISLEQGLRRCLAHDELEVYYQPIFDYRTSTITGMEALLRWKHPEMGFIPPTVFIPLAESIGVMIPIGTWVLRTACAQARAWHEAGFRDLSLAVNLSITQLQQSDLVQMVREILDDSGVPARLLELEITESSAMQNPEKSIRTLYDLKRLGLRISLDDFGTGHSSLSYLKRFPIDTLKVDQSFVRDITSDPDTAAIVTAIIAMGHSLRLKVIAEGVEYTEQSTFLKRCNCDQMQGFLISPPVPASEFPRLLQVPEPDGRVLPAAPK